MASGSQVQASLFGISLILSLRGDSVQGFYTKWYEVLQPTKKVHEDCILENVYKMRLRDSEQLKCSVALYTQDTVLKGRNPAVFD